MVLDDEVDVHKMQTVVMDYTVMVKKAVIIDSVLYELAHVHPELIVMNQLMPVLPSVITDYGTLMRPE